MRAISCIGWSRLVAFLLWLPLAIWTKDPAAELERLNLEKPKLTGQSFAALQPPLHPKVLRALGNLRFEETAPVQAATIPLLLTYKDVVVQAPTGSGKTVAFLVPAYEMLLKEKTAWLKHHVGALVVAPTRELASQICDIAKIFAKETGYPVRQMVGGSNQTQDDEEFFENGGNVLVGTPGRLKECLAAKQPLALVKKLQLLVLDEADRLLDMGFRMTLGNIFDLLPKQRRTGLFSATMSSGVAEIARAGLRNPRKVTVQVQGVEGDQSTPEELRNFWMIVKTAEKLNQLLQFLHDIHTEQPGKVMVFVLTCATVDYLTQLLPVVGNSNSLKTMGLHGKMVQKKREKTYADFVSSEHAVLFCTDVAARGLDIPDVSWIIQFDAPQDPQHFIHRVGRTGRMGKRGQTLIFLAPEERPYISFLASLGVKALEIEPASAVHNILSEARDAVKSDRALFDASLRAYVSIVRAYREHRCESIFKIADLDLGGLANCMGLIKLPYMKELVKAGASVRNRELFLKGFKTENISTDDIPYRDKTRELARQIRQQKEAEKMKKGLFPSRKEKLSSTPWSRKLEKLERKQKRQQARERVPIPQVQDCESESEEEREQLKRDMDLLKKLKKKKITEDEFEKLLS